VNFGARWGAFYLPKFQRLSIDVNYLDGSASTASRSTSSASSARSVCTAWSRLRRAEKGNPRAPVVRLRLRGPVPARGVLRPRAGQRHDRRLPREPFQGIGLEGRPSGRGGRSCARPRQDGGAGTSRAASCNVVFLKLLGRRAGCGERRAALYASARSRSPRRRIRLRRLGSPASSPGRTTNRQIRRLAPTSSP